MGKIKSIFSLPHALLIFLMGLFMAAQSQNPSYPRLYQHALNMPDTVIMDTPEITDYLKTQARNDRELIMLFYYWIAQHISYDVEKFLERDLIYEDVFYTLEHQKTTCEGFVELFCDFCDWVDIPCEIIGGYTKGFRYAGEPLDEINHVWSAVYIDDQWHLADISWGIGYFERSRRGRMPTYQVNLREYYIFADPSFLILTHLPEDEQWQLLENPISREEFFSRAHDRKRARTRTPQSGSHNRSQDPPRIIY